MVTESERFVWLSPELVLQGRKIKNEEQICWVAELVDIIAPSVNPKVCEPYSLWFCIPFAQGATWHGFSAIFNNFGGTDFDFSNQCFLCSGECCCSLSLLFSICLWFAHDKSSRTRTRVSSTEFLWTSVSEKIANPVSNVACCGLPHSKSKKCQHRHKMCSKLKKWWCR